MVTRSPVTNVYLKQHRLDHARLERWAITVIKKCYKQQKPIVVTYLRTHASGGSTHDHMISGLTDLYERRIRPLWPPVIKSIYLRCGEEGEQMVGEWLKGKHKLKKSEEWIAKAWIDHVDNWMEQNAGQKISGIMDEDKAQISRALQSGADQELGSIATANQVISKLDGMSDARAELIARTEVTGAYNYAGLMTAQEMTPGWYKEWNTEIDEHTRDAHANADGQQVPMDEPFIVGDENMMYPGDPDASAGNVANCRCAMNYVPAPDQPIIPQGAEEGEEPTTPSLSDLSSIGGTLAGVLSGEAEEAAPAAAEEAMELPEQLNLSSYAKRVGLPLTASLTDITNALGIADDSTPDQIEAALRSKGL